MKDKYQIQITGDNHISTSIKTLLCADYFKNTMIKKMKIYNMILK